MNKAVGSDTDPVVWKIQGLLQTPYDQTQEYWQVLYMHDLLKYRLCDIENPTWDDVREMIVKFGKNIYFVFGQNEIVGEFMLENFTGAAAQIHFSVHPKVGKFNVAITKWTIEQIFEHTTIRTLFGLTPVTNRAARIFNRKVGFRKIATLPNGVTDRGKIVDGYIMVKEA